MTSNAPQLDETHDPTVRSWVESANDPATDFPIQNLPYATVWDEDRERAHFGVLIGNQLLDLHELSLVDADVPLEDGFEPEQVLYATRAERTAIRRALFGLLRTGASEATATTRAHIQACLITLGTNHSWLPCFAVPNYTDFYASIHHASTVGSMFRPDNPLLPNYKWVPIGYHGRASSIVSTGSTIHRPCGQTKADDAAAPTFGPCKLLDHELEVGVVIAEGNQLGHPVTVAQARDLMLGLTLVNDWSARDMQKWEYQPLGPFLAKNFATTVGAAVVTTDALLPFRCPAFSRPQGDPAPLPYLSDEADQASGGFDITLEVRLQSARMAQDRIEGVVISRSNAFKDMYWTFAQMITHHASNGCNLTPGDLLASGTVSGTEPDTRGCLLELTWDGTSPDGKPKPRKPITLPTGETRTFLADGDSIEIRGWCERPGFRRIGFGSCTGTIAPANPIGV